MMVVHACHGVCVEVKRQLARVSSLFLLYDFQGLNPDHQPWQQAPLPSEPSSQPFLYFLTN